MAEGAAGREGQALSEDGPDSVTRAIVREIEAEGYAVSCVTRLGGGGIEYLAWIDDGGEVRDPAAFLWHGRGETRYTAAVALALALGFDLD